MREEFMWASGARVVESITEQQAQWLEQGADAHILNCKKRQRVNRWWH